MTRAFVALLAAASEVTLAGGAAGAPARSGECEAAGKVCLGTLPSSKKRVVLKSLNGSGEHGVADVTLGIHETKVVLRLTGAPAGVRQAAHIRRGGCEGRILRRLGSIVDGRGVAHAQPLSHLSGFAIVVHATTDDGATIVACGVVPRYVPKR